MDMTSMQDEDLKKVQQTDTTLSAFHHYEDISTHLKQPSDA
jgi:hypothetical protein